MLRTRFYSDLSYWYLIVAERGLSKCEYSQPSLSTDAEPTDIESHLYYASLYTGFGHPWSLVSTGWGAVGGGSSGTNPLKIPRDDQNNFFPQRLWGPIGDFSFVPYGNY